MFFWPGRHVQLALTDGDTITGRIRWSWWPTVLRLSDVTKPTPDGDLLADGIVVVPKHSIMLVQVID